MTQQEPWYRKTAVIIAALIFLAPVGIALLWMSGKFSKNMRIGLTVGSALFFVIVLARDKEQDKTEQPSNAKQDTVEGSQPSAAPVDCESKGLITWLDRIDPETGASIPRCGIRFEVVVTEDKDLPAVVGRSRTLVIEPGRTREEIDDLLQWHYGQIRAELSSMNRPNKQIFVYAYDDNRRAAAGRGEFRGMVQAIATNDSTSRTGEYDLQIATGGS